MRLAPRHLISGLAILAISAVAFTAFAEDAAGSWSGTLSSPDGPLPIKVVIVKNNSLGQIKWEQMIFLGNPEYGCDLHPIDFAAFARACGGTGFTITDPAECGRLQILVAGMVGLLLQQDVELNAVVDGGPTGEDFAGIGAFLAPSAKGVTFSRLVPDGPAEKAGIQVGDLIHRIDGRDAVVVGVGRADLVVARFARVEVVVVRVHARVVQALALTLTEQTEAHADLELRVLGAQTGRGLGELAKRS